MISIERIVGALFSGFMCKLYAGAMAVWIACEAIETLRAPLAAIGAAIK